MRKKFLLMMSLVLFFATGVKCGLYGQNVTIDGTVGAHSSAISTNVPIHNNFDYSISQQYYLADEIGMSEGGIITSIAFQADSDAKFYFDRSLTIYMVNTSDSKLQYNNENNKMKQLNTTDIVFSGTVSFLGDAWNSITLDSPFEYTGENILLCVVDNTGESEISSNNGGNGYEADDFKCFDTYKHDGYYRCIYKSNFISEDNPGTIYDPTSSAIEKATCSKNVPCVQFTFAAPAVAKIGETEYATLADALTAANSMTGDVTVEIYGEGVFTDGMELNGGSFTSISFVGKAEGAKLTVNQTAGGDYLAAHGKTVAFTDLTLAKANPAWSGNSGHMGNYFSLQGGVATYTNCTFENGACTSGGTATYTACTFQNSSEYGLWVYDDALVTVTGGTVDSKKGIKVYSEDEESVTSTLTVENATFTENVTEKPAVAVGYAQSITLIGNTYNNTTAHIELDSGTDANCEGVTFIAQDAEGNNIASTMKVVDRSNSNAACGVLVDNKIYTTVAQAAKEVKAGETVTLLYDTTEEVVLPMGVTLNSNGYTADNVTIAQPFAEHIVLPSSLNENNYSAMFGENTVTDGTNYYETLQAAVEAVAGQANAILYCKPDANVGSLQHAPVTNTLTVYGNDAYVSGDTERDFDLGNTDPNGGNDIAADMTLTVKYLDGCGAWGTKATEHTVNLVFENCDNMGKVFISGTTGTLNISMTDCAFEGVIKEAVYSNADGAITLTKVAFSNLNKAVNLNHKAAGTQTVTINECTFTNCGADVAADQIPVRVLSSVEGGRTILLVEKTTFTGTPTGGADILLDSGEGLTDATIKTTAANVQEGDAEIKSINANDVYEYSNAVAQIGTTKYASLQAAIDAVQNGEEIILQTDCAEKVSFTQTADKSFVLNGNNKEFTGGITIVARAGKDAPSTLVVKNFNCKPTDDVDQFIVSTETNYYPNNITIQDCTFEGSGASSNDVPVTVKSANNLVIKNCTASNVHSLLQNTAGWNITVQNCKVTNAGRGMSLSSAQGVLVDNVEIDALDTKYGIRVDAAYESTTTIKDCKIDAFIPVVARNASANYSLVFNGTNTMTAKNTDGLWCAIGTSEYETNGTMPTAPTGKVKVQLNDTGLSTEGLYGNYIAPVKIGNNEYETLSAALTAANSMTGDVTVEIYDKVTLNTAFSGSYSSINFVGKDTDAEIYLDVQGYITATGKEVAFEDLKLSKSQGGFIDNAGFMNVAFGVYDVTKVTYTNCVFANGAYASSGIVTYTECTFYRSHDKYSLWAYGNVNATVDDCIFDDYRGIKMYAEDKAKNTNLTVKNTVFSALGGESSKPAIVLTYGESVVLEGNTYSDTGVFELDLDGDPNGTTVTSDVAPTCKNDNGACGVLVDNKIYITVAQAAAVATSGSTVTLLYSTEEEVTLPKGVILVIPEGITANNVTVVPSNQYTYAEFNELIRANANGSYDGTEEGTVVILKDSERSYQNNKTAQFFIGATNVNITDPVETVNVTGVTFKFEDDDTSNAYTSGELQIFAKNITFTKCTFIGTAVSPWGVSNSENAETAVFTECTWQNLSGRYGVHQNRASSLTVTACKFENCERGIHTNSSTVASITITGNTFTGIGAGYGVLCLAENGNVGNATLNITGNTAEGQVFLRQLNTTTTYAQVSEILDTKNNTYGTAYVSGSIEPAAPVAKIGETEYASLADAVAAAESGATITIIKTGNYTLPGFANKELTFTALDKANTSLTDWVEKGSQEMMGSTVHFENLTINGKTENYYGLYHSSKVTYKNCNINGLRFLYAPTTFEGCAFNANGVEHSFWTYGSSNVTVTNCTFTYTDRAVNCYSENGANHELDITFSGCSFNYAGTADAPEGAVEINSGSVKSIDVVMNSCTDPEKGAMWFNSQWDSMEGSNTVVTVDGEIVWIVSKGNDFTGYTRKEAIWGEVWGNARESFVIKVLDANGDVMGTTSLNNVGGIIDGDVNVTWNLKLDAASNTDEYWTMEWTTDPTIDNMPAKVELWVDGKKVSGGDVVLNGPDEINKIYAAVTDNTGKILAYDTSVQDAIKAAAAVTGGARTTTAGTVEILSDVTVDKWIMFAEDLTIGDGTLITLNINGVTIDGNGHTLTVNSIESAGNGNYLFYDAQNLTVKDLTINIADGLVGGIGLQSGTISNVTFNGGQYAVLPGANGVTIDGCTFNDTKGYAVYYEDERTSIVVKNNTFNTADGAYAITMRSNEQFTNNTITTGKVNLANSAKSTVTGNNFGTERFKVYNGATATITENTINNLVFSETNAPTASTFTNNTLSAEAQAAIDALPILPGEGTADNPYTISNLAQLKAFRDDVNTYTQDGSHQYKGKYVKLTADIDLAGENWEPIGKNSVGDHQNFLGTFYGEKADGTIPTISNLYINADGDHLGFFARVGSYAEDCTPTVKNIKFNNVNVSSNTTNGHGGSYVAGVIANAGGNSVVAGIEVIGNVYVEGYGYVGGIVGHGYPDIDKCKVTANDGSYIKCHYWCGGGIIGYAGENGTPITNSSVSGVDIWSAYGGAAAIAGLLQDGNRLENISASNVEITSNSDYYMGYIAGNGEASTMTEVSVENVTATANGKPITPTDAVAQIEDAIYFSLKDAFDAAQDDNEIVVLKNVDLKEPITISGKTLTLNLGTYTISDKCTDVLTNNDDVWGLISLKNNAILTITGEGTIDCNYTNVSGGWTGMAYCIDVDNTSKLTVYGGKFINGNGGIQTRGEVTVNDGEFISHNGGTCIMALHSNAKVTVNDGTFKDSVEESDVYTGSGAVWSGFGATVEIKGGTYDFAADPEHGNIVWTLFPAQHAIAGQSNYDINMTVSGGTFTNFNPETDVIVDYSASVGFTFGSVVAEGYDIEETEDGKYGVVKAKVAKIGETAYTSLQDAENAAQDGDEIVLINDIVLDDMVTFFNSASPRMITLNMNGKTIKLSDNWDNTTSKSAFWVCDGLTITGEGKIDASPEGESWAYAIIVGHRTAGTTDGYSGNLVIENGNFYSDDSSVVSVTNGTATILGGYFQSAGPNNDGNYMTLNCIDDMRAADKASIIVKGGTFYMFNPENNAAEGANTNFCADGYAALPDLNNNYVVGAKPTATVNNLGMATIAAGDYMVYGNGDNTADMPLSFVMQFLADQDADDMTNSPYAEWYGDFVITFTGIENDSFTADGCYLAGHYGTFGWVKVPVDGMTIEEGVRYPVMLGVGMGQKYDYICSSVEDFKCALYLTPEILDANPNIEVKLELAIVDNSKGSDAAASALVDNENVYSVTNYTYEAEDFMLPVAKIGETKYKSLADAVTAAQDGETIELLWKQGDPAIAMNASLYGKNVTITGTATVDWSKDWFFVGRGGEGDATLTFYGANLTSASANANSGLGIHVSGREKETDNKYDGTLVIKNSTIVLDYLIDRGTITLDEGANLTVKNGFGIAGRPASETENGTATATISLVNGAKLIVNNHNGMGVGQAASKLEGYGIMNIDAASTFETTQSFNISANGTMNNAGTVNITGTLTNNGTINFTSDAATLATTTEDLTINYNLNQDKKVVYEEGKYKVVDKVYVAQIEGGNKYESLQKAFEAAQDGDKIKVLKDIVLTEGITVAADKVVTLDLADYTISQEKECTESYQMISNKGNLTITGNGKISFKDTSNGEPTFGWGSYTVRNEGTLVVENGTIEHLGEQAFATHMICAIFQYSGSSTINGGTISTPAYRSVRLWKGDMTINGGTFDGQLWVQSVDNTAKLSITGGEFAPNGRDASSVFVGNVSDSNVHYNAEFSVTGGTFNTKIGCNDTEKLTGELITGGTFTETAVNGTNTTLLAEGFEFVPNEDGTYSVIMTSGTQEIALAYGWNWFSSYIDLSDETGLEKVQNALGTNGVQIKGKFNNNSSSYQDLGNGTSAWIGDFNLSTKQMYMINTSATEGVTIEISGNVVDREETTISLGAGWNWISYPLYETLDINEALANHTTAANDDVIKTLDKTSFYDSDLGKWIGDLTELTPGQGYMYKSANATSFVYSAGSSRSAKSDAVSENKFWKSNANKFANNMTVVAMLSIDGELVNDNYEIAAFANGECRGSARPVYVEELDQYILFLTINGEDVQELTFKYYDVNYGTVYELNNRINYSNDAVLGSIDEPYMFNLGILNIEEATLSDINIYPNPTTTDREINLEATCDKVEVFNALGVKVAEYSNVDSIDALETAGIYVIRVTIDGNSRNCRLVVK
ncbi:MAG: right-handed parallel beta-helix repeat-containing protein [Bacteroidales bacterium]|nr:right-handed parallel beta-helix repeat-containing protein [Bacteroidales bacterium]